MGVKGLCSLLKNNRQSYEDLRFRDSKLVVDGNNLVYHLYFKSNLDQNHGGEYLEFQAHIRAFFTTLADCGIKPYVVMDGGAGTSDIKMETLLDRYKDKVQKAHDAAHTGGQKGILPCFTKLVFGQTLRDLKVPVAMCFGEADCQLAALAKGWCCPVLSNDSDFYIFDLPAGLLPLDHFQWDAVRSHGGSYIPCKRYTTSSFCTFFKINRQLLPVFATLAGNDYVDLKEIQWARFLPASRQREKSSAARLEGLLIWLRRFQTLENALTAAMALMPNMSKMNVQTKVREAMKEYDIPGSTLMGFFSQGTAPKLPAEMLSCIPDWVRGPLARGDLSGDMQDVLAHKWRTLPTQVEHSSLPSSNLIPLPLREMLYWLLLGQGGEVEEVYRVGLELTSVKVQPVVQGAAQTLRLDCLPQVGLPTHLPG
ncbi:hypothetical protein CRUP_028527 [Coryphaenoides rupestris]|nr:hypothetical protein CRUP_028527 [Coryphaenoides rupestris]